MPERDKGNLLLSLGLPCFCGGGGLLALAFLLRSREAKLRRELELMASTELLSVDSAVRAAQRRGLNAGAYVELCGQSYTEQPLKSQDKLAMAVETRKLEKVERYKWKEGDYIYEERETTVDGRTRVQRTNTGRREPGKWVPSIQLREVERTASTAASGVCFRELGATSGLMSSPLQICLDLKSFDVEGLLRCQSETKTYSPSTSTNVNVTVNSDTPPPARILGYETRERILPMGQEVYAVGNVAWRYRASVKGMQGEGAVAVLQRAQ
ncbi:unnamed protein product, partial [Effrenium voratum]